MAEIPEYEPLRSYVDATETADVAFVAKCWAQATKLVTRAIVEGGVAEADIADTIDAEVLEGAIVDCGSELYHRRDAPFGVTTFATSDGAASARVAADPMVRARVMISDYLKAGFA